MKSKNYILSVLATGLMAGSLVSCSDFLDTNSKAPILMECFTSIDDDALAAKMVADLDPDQRKRQEIRTAVKKILPKGVLETIKHIKK